MDIPFATRSRFLTECEAAIRSQRDSLEAGTAVVIELEDGGYSGRVVVTIREGDGSAFGTNWEGADITRFPARIKAASTALLNSGCVGMFLVIHEQGVLTIRRS